MSELAFHAAGFAVRHDGRIDERIHARFRAYVRARGIVAPRAEIEEALANAAEIYRRDDALLVCDAVPCANVARVRCDGVPVRRTGCQGLCKHKPMVALRIGEGRELIGRAATERDRDAVAAFARAAWHERSFLVPERSAIEPLRIDPEHGDTSPAARLQGFHFLASRFRGAGRYTDGSYSFTKEVVGTYEAGGRFLALRMEAHYPTSDAGLDVHRALVIVGIGERGALVGRAFTDGGDVHDYEISCDRGELQFADRSPDHGAIWKAIRKRLVPTANGYDERLEVDRGGGFEPYYTIAMRRA